MPIRLIVDDPSRMVLGVANGTLTLAELLDFLREFLAAGKFGYRKIIDLTAAEADFDETGLAAFMEERRVVHVEGPRGPLALVIGEHQKALSYLFAQITNVDRPASIFRSIHAARAWLATHSAPEKQR
jgi:hypothetical protein